MNIHVFLNICIFLDSTLTFLNIHNMWFLKRDLECFISINVHTIECCHDRGQGTSTSLCIHQLRLLHLKSRNTQFQNRNFGCICNDKSEFIASLWLKLHCNTRTSINQIPRIFLPLTKLSSISVVSARRADLGDFCCHDNTMCVRSRRLALVRLMVA